MRNMFIQTAIDIRRGIDYLSKKNFINKEKIGYAGISMGGIIGVLVAAVDTRIKAAVFIVAGGNFLKMVSLLAVFPDAAIITKTIAYIINNFNNSFIVNIYFTSIFTTIFTILIKYETSCHFIYWLSKL